MATLCGLLLAEFRYYFGVNARASA
jgi:hypothetical protein